MLVDEFERRDLIYSSGHSIVSLYSKNIFRKEEISKKTADKITTSSYGGRVAIVKESADKV